MQSCMRYVVHTGRCVVMLSAFSQAASGWVKCSCADVCMFRLVELMVTVKV